MQYAASFASIGVIVILAVYTVRQVKLSTIVPEKGPVQNTNPNLCNAYCQHGNTMISCGLCILPTRQVSKGYPLIHHR